MKKSYLIALSIILVLIILCLSITISMINKKTKQVNADAIQSMENTIQDNENWEENVIEEIDINSLEENILPEENNKEEKNTKNENTTQKTSSNNIPYYIKVNYQAQVVTVYKKDDAGNYTIPIKAMVCSTGTYTPTSGVYSIPARWRWLRLQGYVYGQYSTQIKGNILFHSVPYLRKDDPGSLEYWEYDKLGTYASAGCIRLTVKDAKWIYENCANGTKVEFYASSDPGPLGKPTAQKISNAEGDLKNWDPTDPNPNNPWKNQKEENKQTDIPKNENTTNTITNENTNTQNNTNTQVNENTITNTTTQEKENTITNTQTNTPKIENAIINTVT